MRRSVACGTIAASAAALLLCSAVGGLAQDKLALIKTRQAFMKSQGGDMKTIVTYSKGKADQQAALKAVNDLIAKSSKIDGLFPEGTSSVDFPGKTYAKPALWTDWDKAKLIPGKIESQEEKLKTAIEQDNKAAAGTQAAALNKNGCGSCHGPYRLPVT